MKKHLKLKITGKVQGVWYRASLQREAQKLGIMGFVKNQTDGSVYAELEGNDLVLKQIVDWCWQGSELSRVQNVFVEEGTILGFLSFEVLK